MASGCCDITSGGGSLSMYREDVVAHWRGHRRSKSAGSNCSRDLSLYTATGLYAHHGVTSQQPVIPVSDTNASGFSHITDTTCSSTYEFVRATDKADRHREQRVVEVETEILKECGILSFRPNCLQRFASIQVFVFFSCILVTIQQALSSGYFNSVITTIEKRFDIPSKMSGAVASTFEIGNLLTVIFVSYLGSNRHIPVWIGKGIFITGIGSLVFSLPYFLDLDNPMDSEDIKNLTRTLEENACHLPAALSPLDRASHFVNPPSPEADPTTCNQGRSFHAPSILIFMLAQILIGCGGSPIFTLGTTYIDDHVKKESSSMYIGCMYSMVAFGLVCGFLLGGFLLSFHENAFPTRRIPSDIYPGHPRWIGAWWAGFVICGILLILISIPFFAFPRILTREKKKILWDGMDDQHDNKQKAIVPVEKVGVEEGQKEGTTTENENDTAKSKYGKSIKEIPASVWRLICNPVYVVTCLGSCMELAIVNGFLVFLPKYLENQFSLGKSQASLFTGGIAVPGACFGIFMGGYLLKRFQMKPKGAIQFVLFFNILCMGLYTLLYFLGCDNIRMAGATLPYVNNTQLETFQVNLTADCNMGCHCTQSEIEPVCGRNGITYFSPCHAGCRAEGGPRPHNYTNCACISMDGMVSPEVTAVPLATSGPCPHLCQAMIPFMILLFVITLVVSITQMPLLMITLRSVEEEERAFALGMQFVIFRVFGYIPSPILYGNVIDSTCILWKAHCGKEGGFCLMYNIEHFRIRYIGVCSCLKVAAGLLFFLDWLLIAWRHKKELEQPTTMTVGDLMSSIISLDRLSALGWGEFVTDHRKEMDLEDMQPLGKEDGCDKEQNRGEKQELGDFTSIDASATHTLPPPHLAGSEVCC